MKPFLFSILFSFPLLVNAQIPLSFNEVVKVDSNISKEELFKRARLWYAETFKSSKDVLQISDKEAGELVGKALFNYSSQYFVGSGATRGHVNYTIKIFVKQGRYKYELTDFIHEAYSSNERPKNIGLIMSDTFVHIGFIGGEKIDRKVWKELKSISNDEAQGLISKLKEYMIKPSESDKTDW